MSKAIMAIAAHPGDALFTMGAAVAQHVHNGGSGVFLSLSLGERGHPEIPPAEYGEMQRSAMEKAAALLGAGSVLLCYPDGQIPLGDDIALTVCDLIREHRPGTIVTHWNGSWHKDHRNTFQIVRDAMFYAALPAIARNDPACNPARLFFAENWEDAAGFDPDVLLDISAVCEKWLAACACFPMWRGETRLIRYCDYYQSLAVMRGCLAGCPHAVALMSDPEQRLRRVSSLAK